MLKNFPLEDVGVKVSADWLRQIATGEMKNSGRFQQSEWDQNLALPWSTTSGANENSGYGKMEWVMEKKRQNIEKTNERLMYKQID